MSASRADQANGQDKYHIDSLLHRTQLWGMQPYNPMGARRHATWPWAASLAEVKRVRAQPDTAPADNGYANSAVLQCRQMPPHDYMHDLIQTDLWVAKTVAHALTVKNTWRCCVLGRSGVQQQ